MFTVFGFLLGRRAALGQKGPSLGAAMCHVLGTGRGSSMPWHRVKVAFWSQTAWAQLCYPKLGDLGM